MKREVYWLLFDIHNGGISDPLLFPTYQAFVEEVRDFIAQYWDPKEETGYWEDDLKIIQNGDWGERGNVVMWGSRELEFPDAE